MQIFRSRGLESAGRITGIIFLLFLSHVTGFVDSVVTSSAVSFSGAAGFSSAFSFSSALAQDRKAELAELPPAIRSYVVSPDDLPVFRTRASANSTVDIRSGVLRTAYHVAELDSSRSALIAGSTPEEIAREYVSLSGRDYGWSNDPRDLQLISVSSTSVSTHVLFQQTLDGVPVLYRFVKVSLDEQKRPSFVVNGFDQELVAARPTNSIATSAIAARAQVAVMFETNVDRVSEPTLAILPGERPRFVWRAIVHSEAIGGDWETLIDTEQGSVVSIRDRSFRRRAGARNEDESNVRGLAASSQPPVSNASDRASGNATSARFSATGSGMAFDPDPLSTAGVPYGSPYVDSGDADLAVLNDQRIAVTLNDISVGTDNLYRLEGPYITIIGGGSLSYVPPAEPSADGFSFLRSDDRFEAVNAYYHIDKSQRYVQSLGFADVRNDGVSVNPLAFSRDDSQYSPWSNIIEFGAGGVDDAEDAGVVWHEYGHALLESSAPGLVDGGVEGQALHEGWADYWAASYLRSLADAGKTTRTDWENVFRWDSGDGQLWQGRRIGVPGTYPDDFRCEDVGDINGDSCFIYSDGLIWASALMEIYDEVGRDVSDKLNLQSHKYLSSPATFRDAAEALLQADDDLFGGQYNPILLTVLGNRGLVDAALFAPVAEHEPLHDSEDLGGLSVIRVGATSATAAIDSVFAVYSVDSGPDNRTALDFVGASDYEGTITLPSSQATIRYYIEVKDTNNRYTVLPQSAPLTQYSFVVGPDNTAPTIEHEPIDVVSLVTWPLSIRATVEDNLGVDTVIVSYQLRNVQNGVEQSGEFALPRISGATYRGSVPIPAAILEEGWTIDYSISAVDASVAANTVRSPQTGTHSTSVTLSGQLLAYDFESATDQLIADGEWERGTVSNLLTVAHSGSKVWGTRVSSSYSDATTLSTLSLPTLSLQNLPDVYLVFWHWHDFEHEGPVIPGNNNFAAKLWDGGNVKISIDGGPFQVIEPEGGYSGALESSAANPLAGERVFGGYSYGWRREVVEIPGGAEVRVRFDFGTDNGNSEESLAFAGWFIDDLSIVTALEPDVVVPTVTEVPPRAYTADVQLELPPVIVKATDAVGIESVIMEIDTDSTTVSIRDTRLSMDFADAGRFFAVISPIGVAAGDRIVYRIKVRDFDGNEVIVPAPDQEPLGIVYKTIQNVTALDEAVGSGYWSNDGGGWRATADGRILKRSGLILEPATLPSNADALFLELNHTYRLGPGLGGNVKISSNDGVSWSILDPSAGYPEQFASGDNPLHDEGVFSGNLSATILSKFDLVPWAGQQVRLMFDFGSNREPAATEYWSVEAAEIKTESLDALVERDFELTLNKNYPNPFSTTTTISYTIPEESDVQISVYDLLGRRIVVPLFVRQSAGPHTFTFDGSALGNGAYFVRMITGGQQLTQTIMVAR